jgi:hypothetical protein
MFLYRSDVHATLQAMFKVRDEWWKALVLDTSRERYYAAHGLDGEEGAYAGRRDYQTLADAMFQRCREPKIKIDTTAGEWEFYVQRAVRLLGLTYHPPEAIAVPDPLKYCGRYAATIDGQFHTLEVEFDGTHLFCRAFWPYMKLVPLGGDRFIMSAFPVRLTFLRDEAGGAKAVRVRGNYDWEIMGHTLAMVGSPGR